MRSPKHLIKCSRSFTLCRLMSLDIGAKNLVYNYSNYHLLNVIVHGILPYELCMLLLFLVIFMCIYYIYCKMQATLALYAAKRTFGIVVRSKTKHCAWFTFSQTRHYKNSFFFFFGQVIPWWQFHALKPQA